MVAQIKAYFWAIQNNDIDSARLIELSDYLGYAKDFNESAKFLLKPKKFIESIVDMRPDLFKTRLKNLLKEEDNVIKNWNYILTFIDDNWGELDKLGWRDAKR